MQGGLSCVSLSSLSRYSPRSRRPPKPASPPSLLDPCNIPRKSFSAWPLSATVQSACSPSAAAPARRFGPSHSKTPSIQRSKPLPAPGNTGVHVRLTAGTPSAIRQVEMAVYFVPPGARVVPVNTAKTPKPSPRRTERHSTSPPRRRLAEACRKPSRRPIRRHHAGTSAQHRLRRRHNLDRAQRQRLHRRTKRLHARWRLLNTALLHPTQTPSF